MKRIVYRAVEQTGAIVASVVEMVRCHWCGIAMTVASERVPWNQDDVVTLANGQRICVRCAREDGLVTRLVVTTAR